MILSIALLAIQLAALIFLLVGVHKAQTRQEERIIKYKELIFAQQQKIAKLKSETN